MSVLEVGVLDDSVLEVDEHAVVEAAVDALVIEVDRPDPEAIAPERIEPEPIDPDPVDPVDPAAAPPGVDAARPQLRVVPDRYRRRRRVRIAAAAAAASITVTLFAVVGFNVVLAQNQIELQALQQQLQTEQTRYYDLRDEVAHRSSPARIVSRAAGLGFVRLPTTYLPVAITPPHVGPTETAKTLDKTNRATGGSLDHPAP